MLFTAVVVMLNQADEQLMREALEALEGASRLLRIEATRFHDNLEPIQELQVLKVLNPARTIAAKLQKRLLEE